MELGSAAFGIHFLQLPLKLLKIPSYLWRLSLLGAPSMANGLPFHRNVSQCWLPKWSEAACDKWSADEEGPLSSKQSLWWSELLWRILRCLIICCQSWQMNTAVFIVVSVLLEPDSNAHSSGDRTCFRFGMPKQPWMNQGWTFNTLGD